MGLRETFLNVFSTEAQREARKANNSALKSAREFLRNGNRDKLYPTWSEIAMPDQDMYRGYSYAVIQKRGNKVASLAKENLKTWANSEVVDEFQKKDEIVEHPYLKLIYNSTDFTEKQFWKNISIYLDLAGRYYLGVVRSEIHPTNPKLPILTTDPTKFVMLNPYEIRRVINAQGEVAGYIERKSDGRYREWPLHQIIEMRELNPFDPDGGHWAMTDAAKAAVYTMNQSSDYTVQSLHGNIEAPGIITTDVLLSDEDFTNFTQRVKEHRKGEPLFGNGAGAIKWDAMQIDLDKAALMDINEINRTTLFAVSGTSKTSLGIEQSGTTRETARVQSEQFVSDTAQPRLEDIIDFLNLDYKKHYSREYKQTGYYIEIKSAVGTDYATETQAVSMRQAQVELAANLMNMGYTLESAYQYATGDIELTDLELEKGLDKPQNSEQPGEGEAPEANAPTTSPEGPKSGSDGGNDNPTASEENNAYNADMSELEPHSDLVSNSVEGEQCDPLENLETHDHVCHHGHKVETFVNSVEEREGKVVEETYNAFLEEIRGIEKETISAVATKLNVNAFTVDDLLGARKKKNLLDKLKNLIYNYWGILLPVFASSQMNFRNKQFDKNVSFILTNAIQKKIGSNADKVAEGHLDTILNDALEASNRAFTEVAENAAAELIIEAYEKTPTRFGDYFNEPPTRMEALKAVQKTDILERNKKIYEEANRMAYEGYDRRTIIKAIREKYDDISKNRATLIAQNEMARAFGQSQYQADLQFLNSIGKLDNAYKVWHSTRPESEQDKICPYCMKLIEETNANPIPFTQPFLEYGSSIEVVENGKTRTFTANYESIDGATLHPRCACRYELVFKNAAGEFVKTLNQGETYDVSSTRMGNNSIDSGATDDTSDKPKTLNGGEGSGNFGHKGRPGEVGGSSKDGTGVLGNYEELYLAEGLGEAQTIASDLSKSLLKDIREKHPELIDEAKLNENLRRFYEGYQDQQRRGLSVEKDLSFEDYKQKVLDGEINHDGYVTEQYLWGNYDTLFTNGASPFLEGFFNYNCGANVYGKDKDGRLNYDKEHKLSETIDNNKDLWTNYTGELYRGVSSSQKQLEALLKKGAVINMNGISSWSSKQKIADHFADNTLVRDGDVKIVFVNKSKTHKKTMLYPISSAGGMSTQYEYVQSGSLKYKVGNVYKKGNVYYADVEAI